MEYFEQPQIRNGDAEVKRLMAGQGLQSQRMPCTKAAGSDFSRHAPTAKSTVGLDFPSELLPTDLIPSLCVCQRGEY